MEEEEEEEEDYYYYYYYYFQCALRPSILLCSLASTTLRKIITII
jgi:hypothetical protein